MTQAYKPIVEPTLIETLQALKADINKNLYCHMPGRIQSFNGTNKTASIQILFAAERPDGTILQFPVLVVCPVFTYQGGGAAFQAPIASGDPCLVVFADRNIDAWYQNGATAVPFDQIGGQPGRVHDLSDGMAFVGFNSLADALASYSTTEIRMIAGMTKVAINTNTNLITLANATTSLLTLLQNLCTVLEALTVQVGATAYPLTAASIAEITAYATTLSELLY